MSSHSHGRVIHDARRYDLSLWLRTRGRMGKFRREQLRLARVAPGESVLDVGCGTGTLALAAKRLVGPTGAVHGIDPSPEMIERARRKARLRRLDVRFETAIAQELPFAEATFDAALCTVVLHQLPRGDFKRVFAELRRVLAPGGRALLVDMGGRQDGRGRTPHGHGYRHGQAPFDLDAIVPRLGAAGLEPVETGDVDFELARFERMRYVVAAPRD